MKNLTNSETTWAGLKYVMYYYNATSSYLDPPYLSFVQQQIHT